MEELLATRLVRDIPDFPKPGIIFKDITPVLQHPAAFAEVIDRMVGSALERRPDVIVGIEARGFILGPPVALRLGVGFVPVRKTGKLPYETVRCEYELEYGSAAVEMHCDAIKPGQRVLIIDDLLATGGSAAACACLVEKLGGCVVGMVFLIELAFLRGRERLRGYEVRCLITY